MFSTAAASLIASLFSCYYVGKWLENGWTMVRDNNVGPT